MKRFSAAVMAAALFAPLTAAAQELSDKATGAVYVLTVNGDGTATLAGVDAIDTYTLHQDSCFAEHQIYGVGAWQAVEGGWRIMAQGSQIVSFDGAPPLENPACVPQ